MGFFGSGLALFSSYELLDEESSTRTGILGNSSGNSQQFVQKDAKSAEQVNVMSAEALRGGWKVLEPAGLMVLNGGIFVSYATWNYFRVQNCIHKGAFETFILTWHRLVSVVTDTVFLAQRLVWQGFHDRFTLLQRA